MQTKDLTKNYLQKIADNLKRQMPDLGFALFAFDFNKPNESRYISNANRNDMIKAIEETLLRFKNNEIKEIVPFKEVQNEME